MKPIIHLKDMIREMDVFSDDYKAFLNILTGEFVTLSLEELSAAEEGENVEEFPEWQQDGIRKAGEVLSTDNYRELPSKFEIHEYSIMERFCYSIEDEELSRRLLNSIRGRGAFRYFKDTIYEFGIVEDWYEYRKQAFKEIAIDWLNYHNIAYTDESEETHNNPRAEE